ncbi:DUF4126 family protein [Pseudonocardia sp. DSM 110487]|uniref:DUF4126 family protein n=1 Tax=Pseudonocardia sp. DSM 110487 TaxID=2865833 RepID=UPI001C69E1B3|nr:DUF4126 family protein [Pseudonocardia sp. DSM 110487]QYN31866.1 DUF4126 family protein [Pseudonocardia sp. DSM 110487]
MRSLVSGLLRGAAAGAAGTTAHAAAGTLDRTRRARRLSPTGLLADTAAGVGLGALAGLLRATGVRPPAAVSGILLGLADAWVRGGLPAVLRIVDPRRSADWAADAVAPLVYGFTTHTTLVSVSRVAEGRETVPHASPAALLRAAALGAASGSRSAAGLAAVALTSRPDDTGPVASRLGGRTGGALSGLAAAGELVADKLPGVPSRLAPLGLIPRAAFGATSAAAVARRDGHDPTLPGLVGATAAIGAAVLGVHLRAAAQRRFGSDRPGAVAEDVIAAALGWLGARRPVAAAAPETTERPLAR